jgi:FAD/FMN-containing dehydrogenase
MIDASVLEQFAASLRGQLVQPHDANYDEVRAVWNGMVDRRPALIARCETEDDVVVSVNFARAHDLLVSIRGGGHGVAGKSVCDDGLMIDMSLMNSVAVDPAAKTATVQAGALLGDLDRHAQAAGLVTTAGIDPRTGVAGLTLGGGVGFLARRYGLTIDNLRAVDMVTAAGEIVRASLTQHQDLLWALRGGGGNFGVVTSFEFQLHDFGPDVLAAQVFFPVEQAAEVLRLYRDLTTNAPDEFACYALVVTVPPLDPFPKEHHGHAAIALVACHSGAPEEGRALLAPLDSFGDPILKVIDTMPYVELQQAFRDGTPDGNRYYWKSSFFGELTDEAIETFAGMTQQIPGPFSIIGFEPLGGAIGRVDPAATAFRHRDADYALGIWSGWADPDLDAENIAWTRSLHEAMLPFATKGVYSNYLDNDEGERVSSAFGENFKRLQQVKAEYDPDNFFRMNMNIEPRSVDG